MSDDETRYPAITDAERKRLERARAPFTAPIKTPVGPRRPIDDMTYQRTEDGVDTFRDRPQRFRVEAPFRISIAAGPSWLKPETYAGLLYRLRQKVDETGQLRPGATIDRIDRWTARHVTLEYEAPKFVSDTSQGDTADTATLIRAALETAAEARRRGIPLEELAKTRKVKLSDRLPETAPKELKP